MKRVLVFVMATICSTLAYSASGDTQYAAALKAYKSRCQQGDYINAKFEELKDIEQVNIIAQKFGKPPFVSTCQNLQAKLEQNKSFPAQPETQIPAGDSFEAVDMRYRAELSIYSNKCLRGDYATYKDEWNRDKSRINDLAKQLGRPKFEPKSERICDTSSNQNQSMFTGGGYTPDGKDYTQKKITVQNKETYGDRSERIIRESEEYQQSLKNQQIISTEQPAELQHEERLVDFDGITSTLPDCPIYGVKDSCYGRDGELGDGYLGEFKDGLHEGFGVLAIKEKNIFVVGYFKGNALNGRARYSPLNNLADVHQGTFVNGNFIEQQSERNGSFNWKPLGDWAEKYQEQERRNRGITCTRSFDNRSFNCK